MWRTRTLCWWGSRAAWEFDLTRSRGGAEKDAEGETAEAEGAEVAEFCGASPGGGVSVSRKLAGFGSVLFGVLDFVFGLEPVV